MTTIIDDVKLDFQDVLLMPKRSSLDSRSKVDLTKTFKFKHSSVEYTGVAIIAANMDHVGTMEMARAFSPYDMAVALHKFYSEDELVQYFCSNSANVHTFYTMGITGEDFDKFLNVSRRVQAAMGYGLPYICVDVANGYSRKFVNFVERLRDETSAVIMAGNVVTGDMVYDLLERGADIVKVGIGPGSVCTTRRVTGVGYPQLSAILECQDAAHGAGGLICGDGGVAQPGDLSKAFAAGADFVMLGGMLSGHTECSGEIIGAPDGYPNGDTLLAKGTKPRAEWTMRFYGMSSHDAMDKHYGGKADYRASEGKVVEVPYKGPVSNTIEEMLGGIRSACTYIGARRIKDMPKCATFVKVNRILNESLTRYNV